MTLALTTPAALWLLPLAVLPLLSAVQSPRAYPSLDGLDADPLSTAIDWSIRAAGVVAVAALILGIGGLHRTGQSIEKSGRGAHIVMLMDRSSSMDNTFAGRPPTGAEETKSAAARRLIKDFVERREHDLVGVAAFSTSAMPILPLTDHKDAVVAAVDAMDRPGLAFTNVGLGLALAFDMHEADKSAAARAILLVSDGGAVIDRKVQDRLRQAFAKRPINLYWLFLRTEGTKGISYIPQADEADTPQALPERHLDRFFRSLAVPYRAFEAESPEAVAQAVDEISRLESKPITFVERVPQQDLSGWAYLIAACALALLVLAKLAEVPLLPARERGT